MSDKPHELLDHVEFSALTDPDRNSSKSQLASELIVTGSIDAVDKDDRHLADAESQPLCAILHLDQERVPVRERSREVETFEQAAWVAAVAGRAVVDGDAQQ